MPHDVLGGVYYPMVTRYIKEKNKIKAPFQAWDVLALWGCSHIVMLYTHQHSVNDVVKTCQLPSPFQDTFPGTHFRLGQLCRGQLYFSNTALMQHWTHDLWALWYTLFVWDDQQAANSFKLVRTANQTQECSSMSPLQTALLPSLPEPPSSFALVTSYDTVEWALGLFFSVAWSIVWSPANTCGNV